MAAVSIIIEPHYSRIAEYRADGFTLEDYLRDCAYRCEHSGGHYESREDMVFVERTGQWFGADVYYSGEYKESLTWV